MPEGSPTEVSRCERCLDRGTIQGYTRGMFTGVPCPECRPDAYNRHAGRAPDP